MVRKIHMDPTFEKTLLFESNSNGNIPFSAAVINNAYMADPEDLPKTSSTTTCKNISSKWVNYLAP